METHDVTPQEAFDYAVTALRSAANSNTDPDLTPIVEVQPKVAANFQRCVANVPRTLWERQFASIAAAHRLTYTPPNAGD